MPFKTFIALLTILILFVSSMSFAETEDEMVEKFFKKLEKKHTQKLSWISAYFTVNRVNRFNDYNTFISNESNNFTDGSFSWLGQAKSIGFDLGVFFSKKISWSVGGEFWMKMGESLSQTTIYLPSGTTIENPASDISVLGFTTGIQYYFKNPPKVTGELNGLALRGGATVGFYKVTWDLWSDYSYNNLNLSTSTSTDGTTTSFTDNAPGIMINLGADFPINFFNSVMGVDFGYLYLNFDRVAWYNTQDEEVIATMSGSEEDRVDLTFSGVKGKIEIKKFFSW